MRGLWMMGFCLMTSAVMAQDKGVLDEELQKDVVLRAMAEELERNQNSLHMTDMLAPYFIEYALYDTVRVAVTAELGAISGSDQNRYRSHRVGVRVGSYQLDNTNFSDAGGFEFSPVTIPIEDEYGAIRQAFWWTTDRAYKSSLEDMARKQAFMEGRVVQDKSADFSKESPAVHLEPRRDLLIERTEMDSLAIFISEVFKQYPVIQSSVVQMQLTHWNRYLVNTEGTRIRTPGSLANLQVNVTAQADDGMMLNDSLQLYAGDISSLPGREELIQKCRTLADGLLEVRSAPRMKESYSGPVLFEAPVASGFLLNEFGRRFGGGQRPVGGDLSAEDFSQKLNKRIFPKTVQVIDDPTKALLNDRWVAGHYLFDDQGVASRSVKLVDNGRLVSLLMSRNPSREFGQSTGHGRGFRSQRAIPGCLIFSSSESFDDEGMKQQLIEAFEDEDLSYGLRVASLDAQDPRAPLRIYKVYPDGREELFRGANFGRIDLKTYKRILALGSQPALVHVMTGGSGAISVAAPAVLFEELDLSPVDQDFDVPPILPSPLARQDKAMKPSS